MFDGQKVKVDATNTDTNGVGTSELNAEGEERYVSLMIKTFPPGSYLKADAPLSDQYPPRGDLVYHLGDHLNYGRTGIVQAAVVCRNEIQQATPAAIKLMFGSLDGSDPTRHLQRAAHELHTLLAAQECCGVIELLDAFQVRHHTAIVMPLYRKTARSFLFLYERIPTIVAVPLIRQLTHTVAALHTDLEPRVIIHGDIKPENVLISDDNETVLIDFGASVIVDVAATLTVRLEDVPFRGSLPYTPPESVQWVWKHFLSRDPKQQNSDHLAEIHVASDEAEEQQMSTDVWALGITAFELLTGFTPHQMAVTLYGGQMSALELIELVTDANFISLLLQQAVKDDVISKVAASYLERALDPNPAARATASELASHLFVANAATKTKRLEASADMARNHFLPPNALHGVAPTRKPSRYIPPALVVMKKAYTAFMKKETGIQPRLSKQDDSLSNADSIPVLPLTHSAEDIAPPKAHPPWSKITQWGGTFFGWAKRETSTDQPTQETLLEKEGPTLVQPETKTEQPRSWLTSNPPPKSRAGLARLLSTGFRSRQEQVGPASAPPSPSVPQTSTVPESSLGEEMPASTNSSHEVTVLKLETSSDDSSVDPSSHQSEEPIFQSPMSVNKESEVDPPFESGMDEQQEDSSIHPSPWEALVPDLQDYDATVLPSDLEHELLPASGGKWISPREEAEAPKSTTRLSLIAAVIDGLGTKRVTAQSLPVSPKEKMDADAQLIGFCQSS